MNMIDSEPFGSLYAARQQQEADRRQAMRTFQRQVDASLDETSGMVVPVKMDNGVHCPENPTYPVSSCRWHCHQTESANLAYRDKAFYFTTQARVPGTEIRSPGQWKRFLRQHNLTDDFTIKDHQDMVTRDYAGKKRKERVEKLKQEARKVFSQHLYESMVYKH